ncbi:MAG TPA: hypothetical protein VLB29_06345 [Nocardioidaceae bacterium]|nr:hypothetical protein [Nocardioidaceae bacterium]
MAICVECRSKKTFERSMKRCSDCQLTYEARSGSLPSESSSVADRPAAPPMDPGALLAISICVQLVGGAIIGATVGDGHDMAFVLGVATAWAGFAAMLVSLIAFGVRMGIRSAQGPNRSSS